MTTANLSRGKLLWSGEHWINYIRPADSESNTGMVSLYHSYYSPAGRGTVAYVDIPDDLAGTESSGFTAVCTDNREYAQFIDAQMIRDNPYLKKSPWLRKLATRDAQFTLSGDIQREPSWTIDAGANRIVATWSNLNSLVGPPTIHPQIVFTILLFAEQASIEVDGNRVSGAPYPNEAWSQSLGKAHSSCVFALAETMIEAD